MPAGFALNDRPIRMRLAAALPLVLTLAGCAALDPGGRRAELPAVPTAAPRTTGGETPTASEHKRLVALFGGGVKKGFVYGKTADERPCLAVENPVPITDLHATLFTALGMSPKTVFDIEGRPFYATEDGKGRAVEAIFGA